MVAGRSEGKANEIEFVIWFELLDALTYPVMHPTEPFDRNLWGIVIHMEVWCKLHPPIATDEIVIVLVVFVAIFVGADQRTNFQFIKSGEINAN